MAYDFVQGKKGAVTDVTDVSHSLLFIFFDMYEEKERIYYNSLSYKVIFLGIKRSVTSVTSVTSLDL